MRREGWESLLAEYLQASWQKPFEWGHHDCALFVARWVLLCTGRDHYGDWIGTYASQLGAARAMKERGYRDVADIADAHLIETPVSLAMRGDVILSREGCLGIVGGRRSHFVKLEGMLAEPTRSCSRAWKVA